MFVPPLPSASTTTPAKLPVTVKLLSGWPSPLVSREMVVSPAAVLSVMSSSPSSASVTVIASPSS